MFHRPERSKLFTSKSDLNTSGCRKAPLPKADQLCFIGIKPDTVVLKHNSSTELLLHNESEEQTQIVQYTSHKAPSPS